MTRYIDPTLDAPTVRLLKLCQAAALSSDLPEATGREVVRSARAVRLYAEIWEYELARSTALQVRAALLGSGIAADSVNRHVDRVTTACAALAKRG